MYVLCIELYVYEHLFIGHIKWEMIEMKSLRNLIFFGNEIVE